MKKVMHRSGSRVASTTGHVIVFKAGEPVEVPDAVYEECIKAGAKPVVEQPPAPPAPPAPPVVEQPPAPPAPPVVEQPPAPPAPPVAEQPAPVVEYPGPAPRRRGRARKP